MTKQRLCIVVSQFSWQDTFSKGSTSDQDYTEEEVGTFLAYLPLSCQRCAGYDLYKNNKGEIPSQEYRLSS